jgi:HAD-superfamily subfamily IB hydrolase, TIGR01490
VLLRCFDTDDNRRMNLALFDFDGTLTTRETYGDFMRHAVTPLRRALGAPLFAPMLAGYKLGLVSGNHIRRHVAAFGFRGIPTAHVHAAGECFAAEVLPGLLRPEAMQRLAWHQSRGDKVVLVSGGLDFYLAPWCRQHGLELICSALETCGGHLTGRYHGAQCVGAEKARRVCERHDLAAYATCYAYGDTHEDAAMLALAHKRFYRGREVA